MARQQNPKPASRTSVTLGLILILLLILAFTIVRSWRAIPWHAR